MLPRAGDGAVKITVLLLVALLGCGTSVSTPIEEQPTNGDPCVSGDMLGTWHDGECCTGCIAGPTCRMTPNSLACGAHGENCVPCNGTQTCADGQCGWWDQ